MRYFYFILVLNLIASTAIGQLQKPIHPVNKKVVNSPTKLKPIKGGWQGIPNARTSIIHSFKPPAPTPFYREVKNDRLKVLARSKKGAPIMIKGSLEPTASGRSMHTQVFDYLKAIKAPIQIKEPAAEFIIIDKKTDELGHSHFKMQQQYKGVKVYGGQVWLHGQKGQLNLFNGRNFPTPTLENTKATLSATEAQNIANQDISLKTTLKQLSAWEQKLLGELPEPELVIYHQEPTQKVHLAWHLEMHPNLANEWSYFIDAHSGAVIDAYKTLCQLHHKIGKKEGKDLKTLEKKHSIPTKDNSTILNTNKPQFGPTTTIARDLNDANRTVHAYELSGNYFLIDASRPMFSSSRSELPHDPVGAIWTINAQNTFPENDDFEVFHLVNNNNSWEDPISVSAHHNAGIAYDYFRNTFGRNSINGNGGTIVSIINVSDEDGGGLDNAFWSGSAMFYGNGKNEFLPLAKSLDVAAHEMAHGVIQSTANLRYQGESGAMNESFADVFGVLIDRNDYQLGEDVVNRNIFPTGALRDLADPHNGGTRLGDPGWQPSHVSEQFLGPQDNGGVHINSGITNRAFYLISSNIGREKAEQIYYRALTVYLVNRSQFVDLRASLLQSATDWHGAGSGEVSIVAQAFDAVGILGSDTGAGNQSGGMEEVEVEINPGNDFIIYTNNDKSNLSLADGKGNILLSPFTETGILSRPSVTDDGAAIVFVAADKTIQLITIDAEGNAFQEVIQDEPIWRNVAVSRDGYRVAALREQAINQIEVFDFTLEEWKIFDLYNPTFTEGISTGEVQYADAIEFDFSSQYVLYDAQNAIKGNFGGSDIEYWDIGFLKVYDNGIDNFEQDVQNNIEKLFSGLPENASVGNPTFSKNSPNIIAYEYIDAFDKTQADEQIYELRGHNFNTRADSTIFRSLNLHFPYYSRLDDRIIFNAFFNGNNGIAEIPLRADKISASAASGNILIEATGGAQLGVWFSDGSRVLTSTDDLEKAVEGLQIAPNPFSGNISIQFSLETSKELLIEVYNTLGQQQSSQAIQATRGFNNATIKGAQLPNGTYLVVLKSEEGIVTRKVVKG